MAKESKSCKVLSQIFSGVNTSYTNIAFKWLFWGKCSERKRPRWGLSCIEVWFFRWTMWSCRLVSVSFTCQFTNEARFLRLFEFQSWIFKGKIFVSWDFIYSLSKCNFIKKVYGLVSINLTNYYRKSEIEYYAMLAKTGVHHYTGNNIELGTACGKYFRVCTLSITDPG